VRVRTLEAAVLRRWWGGTRALQTWSVTAKRANEICLRRVDRADREAPIGRRRRVRPQRAGHNLWPRARSSSGHQRIATFQLDDDGRAGHVPNHRALGATLAAMNTMKRQEPSAARSEGCCVSMPCTRVRVTTGMLYSHHVRTGPPSWHADIVAARVVRGGSLDAVRLTPPSSSHGETLLDAALHRCWATASVRLGGSSAVQQRRPRAATSACGCCGGWRSGRAASARGGRSRPMVVASGLF
jgi:hypothetical protein